MDYEETPIKKPKVSGNTLALKGLERVSTLQIVWYLVKRHKFGLVITWAIIITALYLVPFLPSLIIGMFIN